MRQLNQKQAEYIAVHVQKKVAEMSKKKTRKVICYFCAKTKDFRKDLGGFFPRAPLRDVNDPGKGMILDDIEVFWVCLPCLDARGL